MYGQFPFPSLNALRAFGAVGRHLSFGKAAGELHVTAAAVSQQIKNLEDFLGVQLFHRHGRNIALTAAGQQLLLGVENGFRELENSVRPFLTPKSAAYISCSTVGAFAARWLVPRLQRWRDAHSDIDIRISATAVREVFEGQDIDLAIRLGTGNEPGLYTELLLREQVLPLCSPILIDTEPPLQHPSDLRHHQLIHFTPQAGKLNTRWSDWLEIASVDDVDPNRGIFTNDGVAALNAAIAGQGVVLAPRVIASQEIEMSTLVVPFEIELPTQLAWYITMPEKNLARSEIVAFRNWLRAESKRKFG